MWGFRAGQIAPKTWLGCLVPEGVDGAEPAGLLHGEDGLGLGAAAVEAGGGRLLVLDRVGTAVQTVLVGQVTQLKKKMDLNFSLI